MRHLLLLLSIGRPVVTSSQTMACDVPRQCGTGRPVPGTERLSCPA
jgi:hypothetical protein